MRSLMVCLLAVFFLGAQVTKAYAQAAPAYNAVVNNAIGKIVQYKSGIVGTAANSNVVAATMTGLGSAATVVVSGAVASVVAGTSIAWLPLLAAAAAAGVATVAISAGYNWLFGSDGKVQVPGSGGSSSPALTAGQTAYFFNGCWGSTESAALACYAAYMNSYPADAWGSTTKKSFSANGTVLTTCTSWKSGTSWSEPMCNSDNYHGYMNTSTSPYSASSGMYNANIPGSYSGSLPTGQVGSPTQALDPFAAVSTVPETVKAQPLDPALLATMANKLWQQAAAIPGYSGLPYSMSNPITAADVQAWQSANPTAYPTVGDALAPIAPGATAGTNIPVVPMPNTTVTPTTPTNPSTNPGTNPGTTVTVQPGTSGAVNIDVQLNLGPDPGVSAPALEQTPTAQSILSPITSLLPGLKSLQVSGVGACPTPTFTIFNRSYTMDAQCILLEQNRAKIQAVMLAFWAITALFVVLRA